MSQNLRRQLCGSVELATKRRIAMYMASVYQLFADLILIVHLAFVVWVVFGGLAVLRWPRLMWVHVPAVLWGAAIEFIGFVCPLTPLEVWLRDQGGELAYEGDFIGHYITAILYPQGLTRALQVLLGVLALLPNMAVYVYLLSRLRRARARATHG